MCYTVSREREVRKMQAKESKAVDTAKKAKKGVVQVLYGRTVVVLLLILIQACMMVALVNYMRDYAVPVYMILMGIGTIAVIYIINQPGNPAFKITWILCILIFPVFGTVFYLFVKIEIGTKYLKKRLFKLRDDTAIYMKQDEEIFKDLQISKPANANLSYYLSKQVGFPTYQNTKIKYFPVGEKKFLELLRQLKKAKKFIFLEYFIVERGYMWESVLKILERKVKEGVEVRFMYDGMCSISRLPYNYPRVLRMKGIRCKMFNPIKPVLSTQQNNRDHRKICVIDGKVGFTGGINLGDEYINRKERFGHWKDTAIMLEGDAVQSFTMMFLQMWNLDERIGENFQKYVTPLFQEKREDLGFVIPYADNPFDDENVGEEVYLHILNHAKRYVHIMTPYLILDNEMITALTRAVKSGIEVIIIMPHIPDKKYAFALAKTYYGELIEAGVQIYEYTPGFVHAKVFVSDDDTATVGTINLDYRSLYLHFECGAFIYQNAVVEEIERDFQKTLAKCQKITMKDVKERNILYKITGEVFRIVAPLM